MHVGPSLFFRLEQLYELLAYELSNNKELSELFSVKIRHLLSIKKGRYNVLC